MTNKIKASKLPEGDTEKFVKLIDKLSKQAHESGLPDLDYLDQIPDDEIIDEPIPFPFGGHGDFGKWYSKPKNATKSHDH